MNLFKKVQFLLMIPGIVRILMNASNKYALTIFELLAATEQNREDLDTIEKWNNVHDDAMTCANAEIARQRRISSDNRDRLTTLEVWRKDLPRRVENLLRLEVDRVIKEQRDKAETCVVSVAPAYEYRGPQPYLDFCERVGVDPAMIHSDCTPDHTFAWENKNCYRCTAIKLLDNCRVESRYSRRAGAGLGRLFGCMKTDRIVRPNWSCEHFDEYKENGEK